MKKVGYCEFGFKAFTQTSGNCMFEDIPSVVVFHSTTPPGLRYYSNYNTYLGRYNNANVLIYVPDASVEAYKTAWSVHASRIHPLSEYTGRTYY